MPLRVARVEIKQVPSISGLKLNGAVGADSEPSQNRESKRPKSSQVGSSIPNRTEGVVAGEPPFRKRTCAPAAEMEF